MHSKALQNLIVPLSKTEFVGGRGAHMAAWKDQKVQFENMRHHGKIKGLNVGWDMSSLSCDTLPSHWLGQVGQMSPWSQMRALSPWGRSHSSTQDCSSMAFPTRSCPDGFAAIDMLFSALHTTSPAGLRLLARSLSGGMRVSVGISILHSVAATD